MKILAISDIHGKKSAKLINYLKKEDISLVLIAGDITDFYITDSEPLSFVKPFIDELIEECDVNVFSIPGNCDPLGICKVIKKSVSDEKRALCLHNQMITYENVIIIGYGGSNPTPFNSPREIDDDKIYKQIYELLTEYYMENTENNMIVILLTHAPPYNTKADMISDGSHVGSQGIRKSIYKFQPDINICGHIHEACSIDKVGETIIANPGMLEMDGAVLIDISEDSKFTIELIHLE